MGFIPTQTKNNAETKSYYPENSKVRFGEPQARGKKEGYVVVD